MKKRNLFIMILIAMIGCDEEEISDVPKIETYPMTVGSEWTYNVERIMLLYETKTSDKIVKSDTTKKTVSVWVDKDTILNDMIKVTRFKSQEDVNNRVSSQYFYLDSEGLKTYAYSNIHGSDAYARKDYNNISYLGLLINGISENGRLANDKIVFKEKPTLNVELPLNDNSHWTYRHPTETKPLQIDKSVIGTEKINLKGQSFVCFKISYDYANNSSFDGLRVTDWISIEGLIKRQKIMSKRFEFYDSEGNIKYGESTELIVVKELNIN